MAWQLWSGRAGLTDYAISARLQFLWLVYNTMSSSNASRGQLNSCGIEFELERKGDLSHGDQSPRQMRWQHQGFSVSTHNVDVPF